MYYVQLLRVRRAFTWYAAALAAATLLILVTTHSAHHKNLSSLTMLPLSGLILGASLTAIIFAAICGTSLNQENDGVEMVWAKPMSRERLAFEYMLVDLVAIIVAFAYGFLLIVLILASFGVAGAITVDPSAPASLFLGLGIAMMWNGELQALTSWQVGRGGLMIGLSWAFFAWLLPMCTLLAMYWNPTVHAVLVGVSYLDPLTYLPIGNGSHIHITAGGNEGANSIMPLGLWARAAITWTLGLAGWAAATFAWKRLEV